jgi:hypothetical protein
MDRPEDKAERGALPHELVLVLWPALQLGGISGRHLRIICIPPSTLRNQAAHVVTAKTMASYM